MDDTRSTVDYLTVDLNFSSKSSIRSTIEYLTADLNFSSNSSIRSSIEYLTADLKFSSKSSIRSLAEKKLLVSFASFIYNYSNCLRMNRVFLIHRKNCFMITARKLNIFATDDIHS
ncbi:uncharacterized protein LOC107017426 isoform X2 [Solanum pennellii]|uniref:Uncharacterized protein LOC107017426 isoform X2 n=1 Tax=Solanum pennellii TaxID=28526 RepID=A0ABM1V8T5_SOLPN|nr:uncharacterized protein LOC107017426 isoform X2 [Solanum pennellii]